MTRIIVTSAEDHDFSAAASSKEDPHIGGSTDTGLDKVGTAERSTTAHSLAASAAANSQSRKTSNSSTGSAGGGPVSALSSKRNSCSCRKCSLFDDCDPKEATTVIKYLRFRKVLRRLKVYIT